MNDKPKPIFIDMSGVTVRIDPPTQSGLSAHVTFSIPAEYGYEDGRLLAPAKVFETWMSLEHMAAIIATMAPAYRAMIGAAPAQEQGGSDGD